jgi:hypothetical protein
MQFFRGMTVRGACFLVWILLMTAGVGYVAAENRRLANSAKSEAVQVEERVDSALAPKVQALQERIHEHEAELRKVLSLPGVKQQVERERKREGRAERRESSRRERPRSEERDPVVPPVTTPEPEEPEAKPPLPSAPSQTPSDRPPPSDSVPGLGGVGEVPEAPVPTTPDVPTPTTPEVPTPTVPEDVPAVPDVSVPSIPDTSLVDPTPTVP